MNYEDTHLTDKPGGEAVVAWEFNREKQKGLPAKQPNKVFAPCWSLREGEQRPQRAKHLHTNHPMRHCFQTIELLHVKKRTLQSP